MRSYNPRLGCLLLILLFSLPCHMARALARTADDTAEISQTAHAVDQVSDWAYKVEADATIKIVHKGTDIAHCTYPYWGADWAWAAPSLKARLTQGSRFVISGDSSSLGLKFGGNVNTTGDGKLVLQFMIDASRDLHGVIGGGIDWALKLDSPTFAVKPSNPELLARSRGWKWQISASESITVEADEPMASVAFEGGRKNQIRGLFQTGDISAGQRLIRLTITLPSGAERLPTDDERYGSDSTARWYRDALPWNASPVDLRFLNRYERPAGRHGFIKAQGDELVFEDGSKARFWGGNLVAGAIFNTPRKNVALQAKRMAQLGYNLMRIHHHDSDWVDPNIFLNPKENSLVLNPRSLDALDWWIKCLEDEGIYVWLDMHVGRTIKPGDGLTLGKQEIAKNKNGLTGYAYLNPQVRDLMIRFQDAYLSHVNTYTNKAYKDDPALIGVLLTNENDLTSHFGNNFLPNKDVPEHNRIWTDDYKTFASQHGLPENKVFQTWAPGPSKIHLNDLEHRFNKTMIDDLRRLGLRAPIATTSTWGDNPLFSLPALCDGDVLDVHSYGASEAFATNPRYQANFITWIGAAQVYDKPLMITEWNVQYPNRDRFTSPLYVASIASLQGWDAPMIYAYSQTSFVAPPGVDGWTSNIDPGLTALMPAAALAFRRGHLSPARNTYCFMPAKDFFDRSIDPNSSATIRTLVEQSKLTIGIPAVRELPWLKPSQPKGATVISDPDHDYIPPGQTFVSSDTGEITRDWQLGIHTIDSDRTQSVSGWIGGRPLRTRDATFEIDNRKAVVALSSIDDLPISSSKFMLLTAVARVVSNPGNRTPFLSEPVSGQIVIRSKVESLELLSLGGDGRVTNRSTPRRNGETVELKIPAPRGTHWFVLKAQDRQEPAPAASGTVSPKP